MTALAGAKTAIQHCAICMSTIDAGEAATACPACRAPYHADCWSDNGGCAVYGCSQVPKTEGLTALEVPPSFWGREDKRCPQCGTTILALAVRCRHCGTALGAEPEGVSTYERRKRRERRAPILRRLALANMAAALLPGLALVAGVGGALFYAANRQEIRRLPGTYDGLFRISIAVGIAQSAIFVVALVTFLIKNALP